MIVTVTLTPAVDKTVTLPNFRINEVNRVASSRMDPGGKGVNVSKVVHALGGRTVATGILGGGTGAFIRDSLARQGIETDFTFVPQDTRTNLKIIDPERGTNTDINENGAPVGEDVLADVLDKVCRHAGPGDIVVLAGKAPQGTSDDIFARWIESLKAREIRVYLDADGPLLREGVRACPALIKPNDAELARLTGCDPDDLPRLAEAARALCRQGIGTVVVSLGAKGALFVREDTALRGHGLTVPVGSTVGAGDAMMATFAWGAEAGLPFPDICRKALAVSAASVMTPGTQVPDAETIRALEPLTVLEPLDVPIAERS